MTFDLSDNENLTISDTALFPDPSEIFSKGLQLPLPPLTLPLSLSLPLTPSYSLSYSPSLLPSHTLLFSLSSALTSPAPEDWI